MFSRRKVTNVENKEGKKKLELGVDEGKTDSKEQIEMVWKYGADEKRGYLRKCYTKMEGK